MRLGNVSALVWFALYAAWAIARQGESRHDESGQDRWQHGDGAVLGGTLLASLLPFPLAAALAGLAAPLWLWTTSAVGSAERRAALVLAAIGAQLLFGRMFLLLFGKAVLQADTMLVSWAASATAAGNVLTRADGTNVIVSSGCSSVHNISLALLGWVALTQLLALRVDRRLLAWVAASLAAMLTLNAAHRMDTAGNKEARAEIAMIKVAAPAMACQVSDWAIQMFGGGGTGNDYGTAIAYAIARVLRLADGPDEVHRDQLARMEIKKRKGLNHPGWPPLHSTRGAAP